ncbi:apolipoprotein N-acyltransferase [Legionella sp. CNM-4043-24]|uniref:apolipoprotein N-acyltransferase n=1 Tax=Legionella sp. CNM-4043-24 TaxID=3421646 RepID=UPI00403ABA8D
MKKTTGLRPLRFFFFGLLLPLGFAPFHLPGMAILGLALFYYHLSAQKDESPFLSGLLFGLGFFGLGVSWIYVSIHDYGHLHGSVASLITLLFILYLALFPALSALCFKSLTTKPGTVYSCFVFSALWVLSEYTRASFLTGFPWLLTGYGQFDSPIRYLIPLLGVYGASFVACLAACLLATSARHNQNPQKSLYLIAFVLLILAPLALKPVKWATKNTKAISIGVVQANMSMRDKWDETLFWQLLERYQRDVEKLLGLDLIVLPESAIPLPPSYVNDFLSNLDQEARQAGSAILLGIPQPTPSSEDYYFNSLIGIGKAKGVYIKQHLVPFGEYIPKPFLIASSWLGLPEANIKHGHGNQKMVTVHRHPVASLICYEIGYGELLRKQLPRAEWIVSISDDGWFGRSLAPYQQLQMAQVLSMASARYQVVANNDGLSSIINTQGLIQSSLPAFRDGLLKSEIHPSTGTTPWVLYGDLPIMIFSLLIMACALIYRLLTEKDRDAPIAANSKRRYPYQPY